MSTHLFHRTVLLALILTYGAADSATTCSSQQLPITKIINSLGFRLEQLIENQGNYFFSPLSISIALAMVYNGARGITSEEMSQALEYDTIGRNCLPNKISKSFQGVIRALQNEGDGYSFRIANGAFIQTGYQISHRYSSNLAEFFNSKIRFLNFAQEDVASMEKINEWVANYTRGKISKLLAEPLDPLTRMVLMNAVYFKGLWYLPFNEEDTIDGLFHRIGNTPKSVLYMVMQGKINNYYDAENGYSLIELEYSGGNISMIIILPNHQREFPRYDLTSDLLCDLRTKFQSSPVRVTIPKFSMEYERELSKDMIKMGMGDLFSDRANLSGIREGNELHVSLMIHKAVIEVNEQGSEASAFIGVVVDGRNKVSQSDIFVANHPFLFYIIHKDTNTILFSGRVMDP